MRTNFLAYFTVLLLVLASCKEGTVNVRYHGNEHKSLNHENINGYSGSQKIISITG